jgi:hypothetical protein
MSLTPEEKVNRAIWWMLRRLKQEILLLSPRGNVAWSHDGGFAPDDADTDFPTINDQSKILDKLKEMGVLDLEIASADLFIDYFMPYRRSVSTYYILLINDKKFNKTYDHFRKLSIVWDEQARQQNKNAGDGEEVKSKTKFDSPNGVLRHGDIIHSFQRGQRGEKQRILFFRMLWDDRRFIKIGVEKISGTPRTSLYFAVQLHLTTDSETFAQNKKPKNQLFGLIKGINRILVKKNFPVRIERKGSIQLVVTER